MPQCKKNQIRMSNKCISKKSKQGKRLVRTRITIAVLVILGIIAFVLLTTASRGIGNALTSPEFYDIFGIAVFIFIIVLAGWSLYTRRSPYRIFLWILLIIGILGIIIDGTLVTRFLFFLD